MPPRSALSRLEPVGLALALASPLAMLALAPDGLALLGAVLVAAVPIAGLFGLYRLLLRGRPPAARRPFLVPPALGPAPAEIRQAWFEVRRGGAAVHQGTLDDVLRLARAGRVSPFDVVVGAGVETAPAELADLVPLVPSRSEARVRRAYATYLVLALAAAAAGLAVLAAARAASAADEGVALMALLFAVALVPLLLLRREWRRLEAGRARGLVPEPPPRPTLGSAPLDAILVGPTPATSAVMVVVVAVSIAAMRFEDVALALAKDNEKIREGEVWRLLTAGLVHGGAFHLFMNMMFLSHLGRFVERLLGRARMLAVLWGGVAAGSVASTLTNPHRSVGISGGLFALVGALLVIGLRHRKTLPPPARRMLVRAPIEIVVLNLALGLALPIIDNAGHLGGLAGGVLIGLALGVSPATAAALRGSAPGAVAADRPVA